MGWAWCAVEDGANQYLAWYVGQAEIAHDDVEVVGPHSRQGVTSVGDSHGIGALLSEQCGQHVEHAGRVFDDEHANTA